MFHDVQSLWIIISSTKSWLVGLYNTIFKNLFKKIQHCNMAFDHCFCNITPKSQKWWGFQCSKQKKKKDNIFPFDFLVPTASHCFLFQGIVKKLQYVTKSLSSYEDQYKRTLKKNKTKIQLIISSSKLYFTLLIQVYIKHKRYKIQPLKRPVFSFLFLYFLGTNNIGSQRSCDINSSKT